MVTKKCEKSCCGSPSRETPSSTAPWAKSAQYVGISLRDARRWSNISREQSFHSQKLSAKVTKDAENIKGLMVC